MQYQVLRTHEQGWALPHFRLSMHRPVAGDLLIQDSFQINRGRHCRIATLRDGAGKDLLPLLFDVYLVAMRHDEMTLAGFETMEQVGRPIQYLQTWRVLSLNPPPPWEPGAGAPNALAE